MSSALAAFLGILFFIAILAVPFFLIFLGTYLHNRGKAIEGSVHRLEGLYSSEKTTEFGKLEDDLDHEKKRAS